MTFCTLYSICVGLFLALCATPSAIAQTTAPDTIAQRVSLCVSCHGEQGRASREGYLPRIAGKPAGYLHQQLRNFKEGRRHNAAMVNAVALLPDAYLREIAEHFASLDLPYAAPPTQSLDAKARQRGEQLALRGDAAKQLPACASCHGGALTGVLTGELPATPGLLGLPRDYMVGQLGAWRSGERQSHGADCMATVARRMSADDVSAVAAWLAAQAVPLNAKAVAAKMLAALPSAPTSDALPCGAAEKPIPPLKATSPQAVRGAYLAQVGNCAACHTARGGQPYAGGRGIETPFGVVNAGNLTPDVKTGLGSWTAADFWQALHHGRSKDGRALYPAFPYTNTTLVTREDSDALFAYLQSLPSVTQAQPAHALRWPYNTQAALAVWRALYFKPGAFVPDRNQSAQWNRGAYLTQGLAHCNACHGTRNALGAVNAAWPFGGGMIPEQGWYAPSLHNLNQAHANRFPLAETVALLKTGHSEHATASGPMAQVVVQSTQLWTDADIAATATFLRSLPVVTTPHTTLASRTADSAQSVNKPTLGQTIYGKQCATCHGERGEGKRLASPGDPNNSPWAYPPLAGNRAVTLPATANLVRMVKNGGFAPATASIPRPFSMPPSDLTADELAAVLTFIRASWGNQAAAVSAVDVISAR